MNQAGMQEVSDLTGKIVDLTISKNPNPRHEVNRVIDEEVRRLRANALLIRGAAGERANRSFLMWEGSELTEEEKKFRSKHRD